MALVDKADAAAPFVIVKGQKGLNIMHTSWYCALLFPPTVCPMGLGLEWGWGGCVLGVQGMAGFG